MSSSALLVTVILHSVEAATALGEPQVGIALGAGLAPSAFSIDCLGNGPACYSSANGPQVNASALVLFGGFLKAGLRADGAIVPSGHGGGAASLLVVGRVGDAMFAELGIGYGFTWSKDAPASGYDKGFGPAGAAGIGWRIASWVAAVARVEVVLPRPGILAVSAGPELTL